MSPNRRLRSCWGVFSLLTSLLSVLVVAWVFGAGAEMDAFTTAWVVPAYLQAVLLSGLAFVLIPAFVREKAEGREEEAWALAGTFFWITLGVLTLLAVWVAFSAPTVVALTAPGLSSDKAQLTSKMLFVLMFSIPIAGLGNLASGVQNACGSFFWPTMGPILCSFANIAVILLGRAVLGPMTLAWAGLASALIMGMVPLVPFLRHGWKRLLPLTDPRVRNWEGWLPPSLFLESSFVPHQCLSAIMHLVCRMVPYRVWAMPPRSELLSCRYSG